jgi:ubiquinone/menaquinone biosynthesis C-methylase UbiE
MQRIKDNYLQTIETVIAFAGKRVLEIGCGNGSRTIQIAERCREVIATDPNEDLIAQAKAEQSRPNISYNVASADALSFDPHIFDVVFFTLSFHHVPIDRMEKVIDEALRVVAANGHILFLEPAFTGSFFEAEMRFDACDGDERKEKASAYASMLSHQGLVEIAELADETIFTFDGADDFMSSLHPKKGSKMEIDNFLRKHDNVLKADRRINIFQPRNA